MKLEAPVDFDLGQWLYARGEGLAKLVSFAGPARGGVPATIRRENAEYAVVRSGISRRRPEGSRIHYLSASAMRARARPIVSVAVAQRMIGTLRRVAVETGAGAEGIGTERSIVLLEAGTPEDVAHFLRELYARPTPWDAAEKKTLAFYQDLVLPELALVLGVDEEALEAEFAVRYPGAAGLR